MKKMLYSWATLTLLVGWVSFAFAQAPTAVIKVKGYSPQEIADLKWTSPRATGLPNVGVNQVVYLVDTLGNVAGRTYAWSLTVKPAGSTAALDSVDKWQTTFKPDVVGKFTVQLVITTSGGTSKPSTITINAAKYVGVGGMDGLPVDFASGQCALCHAPVFNLWKETGHSSMLKRGIDGVLSSHYSEACIECHTTGYDPDADGNDGFDDVQKEVGWKFPTTLQAGNYDTLKLKYPKLAHRANVQCESCHGPGSAHFGQKAGIAMSLDAALCGYCHEEGAYHVKNTQWKASRHAVVSAEANNASCARCHSGWGFIRRADLIASVQPDPRPTLGFGQISCAVCHDQHRNVPPEQHQVRSLANVTLGDSTTVVTYGGLGKICMQCHISRRNAVQYTNDSTNVLRNGIRFGPHHSNQADMLDGSNAIDYGIPIGSSGHKFAATNACVTCHMATTPAAGQPGNNKVGEHTFAMKSADDVENVAACQPCHGPIKSFDDIMAKADWDEDGSIEPTREEVAGLVDKLDKILPPRTKNGVLDNNVIKANYDWTGLPPLEVVKRKAYTKAWYNLMFVTEDGSEGVHNAGFAIALLRRSIQSITTGDIGAVSIIRPIKDVPNDQGKQVRVMWSKAAGDGVSTNPVTGYSVWRRVDQAAGAAANAVASKEAMFAQGSKENVGKRFTIAQAGSWDFVAWVPAAGHEFYSTVAPTIYDSTAANGIRWSVFFVAAHARSQNYESAPDSGYSIDNLAPFTPSNFALSVVSNKVNLRWADPVDEDFQYFAVYRGTTADFDPQGTKPLATLIGTNFTDNDVKTGDKYYYTVTAFDFAGNQSKYPQPLLASITSVAENGGGAPTEYALQQNYPNPFNPETTIKYQLPGASHVRLSVYTALGQEIRLLVDYSQPAAFHQVVWDGRDNAGNLMPSGVYFYRLETDKFTAIKKMVMMK